jgi:hypothetical protein
MAIDMRECDQCGTPVPENTLEFTDDNNALCERCMRRSERSYSDLTEGESPYYVVECDQKYVFCCTDLVLARGCASYMGKGDCGGYIVVRLTNSDAPRGNIINTLGDIL